MMVCNYAPTLADMKAMLDGDRLIELPQPYGPYYALLQSGKTWEELTRGLPVWVKGGKWWRQEGSGTVLAATELRYTARHLYPCLTDNQLADYMTAKESDK